MIARERLFGEVEIGAPKLAPGGRLLAFLAPRDGVLNIWLGETRPDADARPLTASRRAIRGYFWAWNGRQLVYRVDPAGDERYQYFALDIAGGTVTALTPEFGAAEQRVAAWGEGFFMSNNNDPSLPDEILLLSNEIEEGRNDIWRINLASGERMLVQTGSPNVQRWLVDNSLRVRGYLSGEADGATGLWLRDADAGEFTERLRFAADDFVAYLPVEFSADNNSLFLLEASGRDTKALVALDLRSLQRQVLAADDEVDAEGVIFDPTRHVPLSVDFNKGRLERSVLDSQYAAVLALAAAEHSGDVMVDPAIGLDVVLAYYIGPGSQYSIMLLDTEQHKAFALGGAPPAIADSQDCEAQPIELLARDGLPLHGYLTLPLDYKKPGPLVLLVHGGPGERDYIGSSSEVQWLAGLGYACLQVKFRGSRGYGKRFQAAGDGQWGAAMQDDLSDAVAWAVGQSLADPARVGIMGESYGGFAVLAGLTLTPELYACGIALNPVTDLEAHLRHWDELRPAWRAQTERRVGRLPRYADGPRAGEFKDEADWSTAERQEVEALRQRSPLQRVSQLRAPLLIGHGAADTRVLEADSARFVEACRAQGADIEYVVYQGEGHWLAKPENYEDYYGRAAKLLSRAIGGVTPRLPTE